MKIYTEEQVVETVWKFKPLVGRTAILIELNSLTHIELPSDEEIEEGLINYIKGTYLDTFAKRSFFKAGAKWVIEQIKQQGK
jgi:hypothetical protein